MESQNYDKEKGKKIAKYIEINGVIDISGSPVSGQHFVDSLNAWLEESEWDFVGQLGVVMPKTDEGETAPISESRPKLKINKAELVAFFWVMVMLVAGIFSINFNEYFHNSLIGILGVWFVWTAGVKLGREVLK